MSALPPRPAGELDADHGQYREGHLRWRRHRVAQDGGGDQNPTGYAQVVEERGGGSVAKSYVYGHSVRAVGKPRPNLSRSSMVVHRDRSE